jgi:hypothetical protein
MKDSVQCDTEDPLDDLQEDSTELQASSYLSGASYNSNTTEDDASKVITKDYRSMIQTAAIEFEQVLEETKVNAKRLLKEISLYANEGAAVQNAWHEPQQSEHEEAARLDSIEPDVLGATFSLQQQQHHMHQAVGEGGGPRIGV